MHARIWIVLLESDDLSSNGSEVAKIHDWQRLYPAWRFIHESLVIATIAGS